jgi:hypothetical protein
MGVSYILLCGVLVNPTGQQDSEAQRTAYNVPRKGQEVRKL